MIARRITPQMPVKPDASVVASISAGNAVSITNVPTGAQEVTVMVCADGVWLDMILVQARD